MLTASHKFLRHWPWLAIGLALLAAVGWQVFCPAGQPGALASSSAAPASASVLSPAGSRIRGVSWVAADSASSTDFEPLLRNRVNWISQTPFGWQSGAATPEIRWSSGAGNQPNWRYWGETDRGLAFTTKLARQHGIRTLLKPHLWLRNGGTWPGDINMSSAADWQAWFANYTSFILHYAELAEAHNMEALCIGTELEHASVGHEAEWRVLIKQIRKVYRGQLTYAANWSGEFERVRFWDALDFIGIQAYFPLSSAPAPAKATLLAAWQGPLKRIEAVQKQYRKPVLFTEIGYKTTPDAAIQPWAWPDRNALPAPPDEATQRACYEAMFETFWEQPWFGGLFVWKWYPGLKPDGSARRHLDFTPQHKPAEQVMAQWFKK